MLPQDLPALLRTYDMSLARFFGKFLVARVIGPPNWPCLLLEMAPAQVHPSGRRQSPFLPGTAEDRDDGHCIFYEEAAGCLVHAAKPTGGRVFRCPDMTGAAPIFINKAMRAPYWNANQHLFEVLFPGYGSLHAQMRPLYLRARSCWTSDPQTARPRPVTGRESEAKTIDGEIKEFILQRMAPLLQQEPRDGPWTYDPMPRHVDSLAQTNGSACAVGEEGN